MSLNSQSAPEEPFSTSVCLSVSMMVKLSHAQEQSKVLLISKVLNMNTFTTTNTNDAKRIVNCCSDATLVQSDEVSFYPVKLEYNQQMASPSYTLNIKGQFLLLTLRCII